MVDAHIHLQDISKDKREEFLERLCDTEGGAFFCNGTSPQNWREVVSIAHHVQGVTPFIGVHPWFVDDLPSDWEADFVHLLKHGQCGIGEIGLDKTPKGGNFERQKIIFVRQLDVAAMLGRAFVLHCVKAWEPMLAVLRSYDFQKLPFIVHSFIGSQEILEELLRMGARISLSPRSFGQKGIEPLFAQIPDDRLLLETDFPYLSGKEKEMVGIDDYVQAIASVYERSARLKNVGVERLREQVLANANEVLNFI